MGYEEAIKGEAQRTEFRKAEKRYKLYKALRGSVHKAKLTDDLPPTDLTNVIDFSNIKHDNLPLNVSIAKLDYPCPWPVFTITQRPGFYFLLGALDIDEQFGLIKESLGSFPQPPSRTNHTEFYGPIHNLWSAHAGPNRQHLVQLSNGTWEFMEEAALPSKSKSIAASTLVKKLRWATLGLQFDWSKRNYDVSLPHVKIPHKLSQLAKELARPAMQKGEFHAEAAIVNYFGSDDMLGGHLDDMEADWSKPIVSISLGCKAIFLLGGESREDTPFAMFLRSGDVVLMAGPARQCFHATHISSMWKGLEYKQFFGVWIGKKMSSTASAFIC
ncbi:alpha-ketoglutarate-dependent dioxygenase alkB isoform X2 [Cryptomeria japonica]|uniref:alpha-ketoglutarate-dependent dioxygenase alkB isoform X2 n=1 Tax=Cryptomeria japonica TaxID=3369 RepID=UPI0025AC7960|nr:alpha-ketoglutarate-dependent dioxygenase alkB isoform X2 [Cryptomeria japonica]